MTISFTHTLAKALQRIDILQETHHHIHTCESMADDHDTAIARYGNAKWDIVDMLNQRYSAILNQEFNLYHWLCYNEADEVSYFLTETGSNALRYAEWKMPSTFHLWLGSKGFIIGIEQQGKGFSARQVNEQKIKNNDGAAFDFFRSCQNVIFFDDPNDAKVVYMECLLESPRGKD